MEFLHRFWRLLRAPSSAVEVECEDLEKSISKCWRQELKAMYIGKQTDTACLSARDRVDMQETLSVCKIY